MSIGWVRSSGSIWIQTCKLWNSFKKNKYLSITLLLHMDCAILRWFWYFLHSRVSNCNECLLRQMKWVSLVGFFSFKYTGILCMVLHFSNSTLLLKIRLCPHAALSKHYVYSYQTTVRRTHAQQLAYHEQARHAEQQREDALKELSSQQLQVANMASEERAETKRYLRQRQQAQKEYEMDQAITRVRYTWLNDHKYFGHAILVQSQQD